ncbi:MULTISPECIES: hypothetical protein [unclassified Streptomyces]|uniref:hypothetical protein n=1 Tax=unclassified Streptomyces TaxID=2593676 RepID=UPI0036FDEF3E
MIESRPPATGPDHRPRSPNRRTVVELLEAVRSFSHGLTLPARLREALYRLKMAPGATGRAR